MSKMTKREAFSKANAIVAMLKMENYSRAAETLIKSPVKVAVFAGAIMAQENLDCTSAMDFLIAYLDQTDTKSVSES